MSSLYLASCGSTRALQGVISKTTNTSTNISPVLKTTLLPPFYESKYLYYNTFFILIDDSDTSTLHSTLAKSNTNDDASWQLVFFVSIT